MGFSWSKVYKKSDDVLLSDILLSRCVSKDELELRHDKRDGWFSRDDSVSLLTCVDRFASSLRGHLNKRQAIATLINSSYCSTL